jgi:hypothetical protein
VLELPRLLPGIQRLLLWLGLHVRVGVHLLVRGQLLSGMKPAAAALPAHPRSAPAVHSPAAVGRSIRLGLVNDAAQLGTMRPLTRLTAADLFGS